MALVDERGRLFGRLNLFDALVIVLVLGLIPLSYAAYVLFRPPLPTLTRVEPAALFDQPNLRVTVHGENFRPYMRVSFNAIQGQTFLFKDTTEAEVDLNGAPPGVYDVVLYDFSQERARLPKALTIHPSPLPDAAMIVVGTLGNIKPELAGQLAAGVKLPEIGEIVAVGTLQPQVSRVFARAAEVEVPVPNAQQLPVIIRMACYVRTAQGAPECAGGGVALQPTAMLFINTPIGRLPMQIDQVRGTQPLVPVTVTVRFSDSAGVLALMRAGDVDGGEFRNPLGLNARIVSVSGAGAARDVQIALDAQAGTAGWLFRNAPLRAGAPFTFRTETYQVSGTVIAVNKSAATP
jgi:hypothetical protein